MRHRIVAVLTTTLIVSLTLGGCQTMPKSQTAAASAAQRAEMIRLDNGMRVVLLPDHSAPVVALQTWVRYGSADERPELAGIAHVFEHMLFKGTERFPNGEIGGLIEGAGGIVNAWTSYDETVYHTVIGSRFWERGFDVLNDAVLHSLLDADELARELEVVREEIRRGKDNPDREMWERLVGLAFKKHPYGRPVIGYDEVVAGLTREQLLEIYEHWYVPNNMILVAVGDFDRARLLELVRERFGAVPAGRLPERPRPAEPAQDEIRIATFDFDARLARVSLAFPAPAFDHPDAPALDLLSQLLGGGYNSRLYQELKRRRDLVLDVSSYAFTPIDPGLFLVGAAFDPAQAREVVETLARTIFTVDGLRFAADEIEAARTRIRSSFVHAQETYQGVARRLGRATLSWDDPNASERYLAAVEAVTEADLRRVARVWLDPQRLNVALMVPRGHSVPAETEIAAWLRPGAAGAAVPEPLEVSDDGVEVHALPGGIRLVVQPDNKAPLVGIRVTAVGGQRAEVAGQEGLAELMTTLWDRGTDLLSAGEIERALDRMGGHLGAGSGRDAISLYGRFLAERFEEGLELFFDVLMHPQIPEEEFRRERADQIREIEALAEQRARYAMQRFYEVFYEAHPYHGLSLGRVEALEKLTREDLRRFHGEHLHPERLVISVVGAIEPAEAVRLVTAALPAGLREPGAVSPDREVPPIPERQALRERVETVPGQQTHILWGFPTVNRLHEDRFALQVLDTILSGMGGRLFVELRDRKSLAYAVTSFDEYPTDGGSLILYIGCAPDKEAEAIREFERVIRELQTEGVSAEEVEQAVTYLEGVGDIRLQSTAGRTSAFNGGMLHHGRWDQVRISREALRQVTPEDVRAVAQRYLQADRSVRMILRGGGE